MVVGVTCNYDAAFDHLYFSAEKKAAADAERRHERKGLEFITDPITLSGQTATEITGRSRLALLRKTLDSFGIKRSKNQRMFHREMTKVIIKQLFRDDLNQELDELFREFECSKFVQEMMVVTPRRWGKTYAVAMFVAACAVALEKTEQAIFSTGRRASQKLLELVYRFLCMVPGMAESIIKKNIETIWIQGPHGPTDIRKIYSYPSKVKVRLYMSCVRMYASSEVYT